MSFLDIEPTVHADLEQLTPEWHNLHHGRLTSSKMDSIITAAGAPSKSEAVRKLAIKICMEREMGGTDEEESFWGNYWTRRGLELEEEARASFEFTEGVEVKEVGFIERGIFGCSPDGVIDTPATYRDLEIKCLAQENHGLVRLKGPERKHVIQIHSRLIIGNFDACEYLGYHPEHRDNRVTFERDSLTIQVEAAMIAFEELVFKTADELGININ